MHDFTFKNKTILRSQWHLTHLQDHLYIIIMCNNSHGPESGTRNVQTLMAYFALPVGGTRAAKLPLISTDCP